jgi:hypothetical protein
MNGLLPDRSGRDAGGPDSYEPRQGTDSHLLGDWNGVRRRLLARGVRFDSGTSAIPSGASRAGRSSSLRLGAPPLRSGRKRCGPPPSAPGPPLEGRDGRGRAKEIKMRVCSLEELLHLTRAEWFGLHHKSQALSLNCPRAPPSALPPSPICEIFAGCWRGASLRRASEN